MRRPLGWILGVASLLLHLFTVYCFAQQPDRFAAFTLMPIWLWGGTGLMLAVVAFLLLRTPLAMVMTAVWAITMILGADEARVLANFGKSAPLPGPAASDHGKQVLRVLTLNCSFFHHGNPAADIAKWQPDVVLLQDIATPQVREIADLLYGGHGDYRTHQTNGVVTRWKIVRESHHSGQRDHQVTILAPTGSTFEVVNVHLRTAATDLRLWKPAAWREHRSNRVLRKQELNFTLQVLEQTTRFPTTPTLFGGDFNAPASDVVYRPLQQNFTDAFAASGTGWGNTFHRRLPLLRIDQIYATRHFTPVRSGVIVTRFSDHRMVIADFLTSLIPVP